MKAIILAGGRATRLPYSAKDKPKALVEVGGKTILQRQIELLNKHNFFDIRLALGYKADMMIDWVSEYKKNGGDKRLAIDYVIEPRALDTGGAIKFASRGLKEPFMVFNGDILSDADFSAFLDKFIKRPEENAMIVFHIPSAASYGIIKGKGGKVASFLEKPDKPIPGKVNAGFYILSPSVFKGVRRQRFSIEREIFPNLAQSGNLAFYVHKGFWTDAGTEERLAEARAFYNRK